MQQVRRRRAVGVFASLLACTLFYACSDEANSKEGMAPVDSAASTSAAVESGPVSLTVQLTGLLLLVPPTTTGGPTQVMMPRIPGHDALLGFRGPKTGHCWRYDSKREICYANMDNWVLEPIGIKPAPEGGSTNSARNLLNLTHGSGGKKIDVNAAKARIRSHLTLGAGIEAEPCRLAEWTYDPVGDNDDAKPRRVQLVNVMNWQISDLSASSIVLARHRPNGSNRQEIATLTPDEDGKIEILVMHLPQKELREFLKLTGVPDDTPSSSDQTPPSAPHEAEADPVAELEKHFHAFYDLIGGVGTNERPMPTEVKQLKEWCPITVLGIGNAFPRPANLSALRLRRAPDRIDGTKTLSCVMTFAEPS